MSLLTTSRHHDLDFSGHQSKLGLTKSTSQVLSRRRTTAGIETWSFDESSSCSTSPFLFPSSRTSSSSRGVRSSTVIMKLEEGVHSTLVYDLVWTMVTDRGQDKLNVNDNCETRYAYRVFIQHDIHYTRDMTNLMEYSADPRGRENIRYGDILTGYYRGSAHAKLCPTAPTEQYLNVTLRTSVRRPYLLKSDL